MIAKTEEKILKKLEHIERLLVRILPRATNLTEREVLKIIQAGDREVAQGKAKTLVSLKELR